MLPVRQKLVSTVVPGRFKHYQGRKSSTLWVAVLGRLMSTPVSEVLLVLQLRCQHVACCKNVDVWSICVPCSKN